MRFLALLLATLSFSAVAQVYKWTDENGVTHFGTQPPAGQREEVEIRSSAPGDLGASQSKPADKKEPSSVQAASDSQLSPQMKFHQEANRRACNLAKTELENAERLVTLGESQKAYDFVLEPRKKKVVYWKSRVDLHCKDD